MTRDELNDRLDALIGEEIKYENELEHGWGTSYIEAKQNAERIRAEILAAWDAQQKEIERLRSLVE